MKVSSFVVGLSLLVFLCLANSAHPQQGYLLRGNEGHIASSGNQAAMSKALAPGGLLSTNGVQGVQRSRDRNLYPMKNCVGLYFGIAANPTRLRSPVNFDISDWERKGLLSESASNPESRGRLWLDRYPPKRIYPWFNFGMQYNIYEQLQVQADFEISPFERVSGQAMNLGIIYDFIRFNRKHQVALGGSPLMVGVVLRSGYSATNYNLPLEQVSGGYGNYIDGINAETPIGENIAFNYRSFYGKMGLRFTFRLYDQLAFQLEGGYMYMPFTRVRLVFPDNEPERPEDVEWGNALIVDVDGTNNTPKREPLFSNRGVYLGLNIALTITKSAITYRTGR